MRTPAWNTTTVAACQAAVKGEIDAVASERGASERLAAALEIVRATRDEVDAERQLRCFVAVMSALVHHARHGGLTGAKARGLADLAQSILRVQGIATQGSRLTFLHRDLALVMSQLHRRSGHHWDAAWEQGLAAKLAGSSPETMLAVDLLAAGRRLLRLGHARLALAKFAAAEACERTARTRAGIFVGRIQALRLSAQLDAAQAAVAAARAQDGLTDMERLELDWEERCIEAQRTVSADGLLAATGRRGAHRWPLFFLETYCWTRALPTRTDHVRLPMVRSMGRRRSLGATKAGLFFRCVQAIESAHEPTAPLLVRLREIGAVLGRTRALVSVDKELLVRAAAARWLTRARAFDLAALALAEYEGLCRRLSDGASPDTLGLVRDMMDRDWYRGAPARASDELAS
jgi:hypothetical protein